MLTIFTWEFSSSKPFYVIMEVDFFRGMYMKKTVYFGTYTRRISQGIYKAEFDTETGKLANLKLFAAEPSPTYLAFDQDHIYTL